MKFVLIGGGSYVFAQAVLEDVIIKHRFNGCELMLVDTDQATAEAMTAGGRRQLQFEMNRVQLKFHGMAPPNLGFVAAVDGDLLAHECIEQESVIE